MKKHLLLLSAFLICLSVSAQVSLPNGNFESWAQGSYDIPLYYTHSSNENNFYMNLPFNVTQSTLAYHGSKALQIVTVANATDTSIGYYMNATSANGNPSTWTGGIPYNQQATGIRGYYQYNVASADSAVMVAEFRLAGVSIGTYIVKFSGVHPSYTPFNFTFNPPLPSAPDTVIFAAASGDFTASTYVVGATLLIDSISFTGVGSQPAMFNGDFESWATNTLTSPNNWIVQGYQGQGVTRTTDRHAGSYAVELTTYQDDHGFGPMAQGGNVSTGYYDNSCSCMRGGYPFSNMIDTLAFWYKYTPVNNDSAQVGMSFLQNGTNIWGAGMNLIASPNYQYVEIPFNIGQTPDTVLINFQSSLWQDSLLTYLGSVLRVDEAHFKSQPLTTGILNFKNTEDFSVYPNPSADGVFMLNQSVAEKDIRVYNVLGEVVPSSLTGGTQLTLPSVSSGIYFVKINSGDKNFTRKISIVKP